MPISKEQIFIAADALVAAGVQPTLEAIRAKLGVATPPLTDLIAETDAINAWNAHCAANLQLAGKAVPTEIVERITQFSTELWAAALDRANQLLAPERKAMEIARAKFESEQRQAQSDSQALYAQLFAADERAGVALARTDELNQKVADLRTTLTQLSEHNRELVAAIKTTVGIVNEP